MSGGESRKIAAAHGVTYRSNRAGAPTAPAGPGRLRVDLEPAHDDSGGDEAMKAQGSRCRTDHMEKEGEEA
jgi:hypothetical protein